jgi:hypothetical protein
MKSFVSTCTTDGRVCALSQNETEQMHFHLQENCDSRTPEHTMQHNGYLQWVHAKHT